MSTFATFRKGAAKIGNYSDEVAELSQQIFHKVQMAFPFGNRVHYYFQLFRDKNAGFRRRHG